MEPGTPMEKIKAYQQIESFVSEEFAEQVAEELGLSETDLGIRLYGKDSESDFLFRCYSLGEIENIYAFEEAASRLTNTVTVDFLFVLKNGKRLAIEVKTKQQPNKPIISINRLKKQREFAGLFGFELYYAVLIGDVWQLHSVDYVEKKKGIIAEDSYLDCDMKILGECIFSFRDKITLKTYYRKEDKKSLKVNIAKVGVEMAGVAHPQLGVVERCILEVGNKAILTVNRQNAQQLLFIILVVRALFVEAGEDHQEVIKQKNGRTLVIQTNKSTIILSLSDFLIERVYSLWNGRKRIANPRKFIAHLVDKKERELLSSDSVLSCLSYLYEKGLDVNVLHITNEGKQGFIWKNLNDSHPELFEPEEPINN